MQKLGFGIIGILLIAMTYYFTTGSAQATEAMKTRVNTELSKLKKNGFAVQERSVKETKEHFVLSFENPEKLVTFFKNQGSEITLEDAEALKGLKVGVDLAYLNDTYSALSADVYPLSLPAALLNNPELSDADKTFIVQINEMVKRKTVLIHIDFNKMLSSFKGFIKDINQTFSVETALTLQLKGTSFNGTIKKDRVNTLKQKIEGIQILSGDDLKIDLTKLYSDFALTGKSVYDSSYKYTLKNANIEVRKETHVLSVNAEKVKGKNSTAVKNDLASNKVSMQAENVIIVNNNETTKLMQPQFAFTINNLDMHLLTQLGETDAEDNASINTLVQSLISKGIHMEIPTFNVNKLVYNNQEMDGFSLTSSLELNKTTDLAIIRENPFALVDAINSKTKVTLSEAIFRLIAQDPRAMLFSMLIQPQVINDKKVYEVELKNGKVSVNGLPLF